MAAKVDKEEVEGLLNDPTSLQNHYKEKKNALARKIVITKLVFAIVGVTLLFCISFGIGFVLGWKLMTEDSSHQNNDISIWGGTVSGNESISQWIPGKIIPDNIKNNLK